VALFDAIQIEVVKQFYRNNIPTEVFMSSVTRAHLADELRRHHADYEIKGKKTTVSETKNRVPSDLSIRIHEKSFRLFIRLKESLPNDFFEFSFKKLTERINPTNGRKEYVAEP
jgi:hypothetical protein